MKTRNLQTLPLTVVALAVLALTAGNAVAQNAPTSTTTAAPPAAAVQAVPQLSYGVPEVLQLSQAKVSDSVIISYVQNSGNNYGLNAAQIIYLKQQGISSDVINAMINQRSQSAQPASTAAATSQSYNADANTPQTTTSSQPAVTYVQSVPTSSVYVVPDTQTYYYNNWLYYHNPYYGYYPGYYYPYPAVSVSFGWGGGWGGYRGGWHGGGHDGGFHGGGPRGGGWHH